MIRRILRVVTCICGIRVWCHLLDLTMSHGAKDLTVYPLGPLLTTNRVLVSPNGSTLSLPTQTVFSRVEFIIDFCLDGLILGVLW